jgi:hypothetical protein
MDKITRWAVVVIEVCQLIGFSSSLALSWGQSQICFLENGTRKAGGFSYVG